MALVIQPGDLLIGDDPDLDPERVWFVAAYDQCHANLLTDQQITHVETKHVNMLWNIVFDVWRPPT